MPQIKFNSNRYFYNSINLNKIKFFLCYNYSPYFKSLIKECYIRKVVGLYQKLNMIEISSCLKVSHLSFSNIYNRSKSATLITTIRKFLKIYAIVFGYCVKILILLKHWLKSYIIFRLAKPRNILFNCLIRVACNKNTVIKEFLAELSASIFHTT